MGSTKYSTPSGSVTEQWERIARWLRANLDSPSITGADVSAIDSARQATGVTWPAERPRSSRSSTGSRRPRTSSCFR